MLVGKVPRGKDRGLRRIPFELVPSSNRCSCTKTRALLVQALAWWPQEGTARSDSLRQGRLQYAPFLAQAVRQNVAGQKGAEYARDARRDYRLL